MTAAAVEQDQADVPEPSLRDRRLAECLELRAAAGGRLAQAVAAELAEDLPALEQAWVESGDAASAAYGALEAPRQAKEDRDAAVTQAETELAGWRSQAGDESTPFAERVRLRAQIADGEAELEMLRQKADFAQAQLLPFLDAYARAEAEFEKATAALEGRKLNATPALAFFGAGQKTAAYEAFRFGTALESALRNRDHFEHDAAVDHMLHLCEVSGFRTENYADRLPSDAEQARRFWDQVRADAVAGMAADPAPSMVDVMKQTEAEFENAALQQHRTVIDDYRSPATAVPRTAAVDSYRQVQSLRDLGIR